MSEFSSLRPTQYVGEASERERESVVVVVVAASVAVVALVWVRSTVWVGWLAHVLVGEPPRIVVREPRTRAKKREIETQTLQRWTTVLYAYVWYRRAWKRWRHTHNDDVAQNCGQHETRYIGRHARVATPNINVSEWCAMCEVLCLLGWG